MKVLHSWLQDYFGKPLSSPEKLADALSLHAFEVEGVEGEGDEAVIDVDVLPNRGSDCLCHRGIAKELSVILSIPIKEDPLRATLPQWERGEGLSVAIDNPVLCRRFSALFLSDVEVKDSPLWMRKRLETLGQRSINNVVDATNYAMLSLGQPLHAFDADKLAGEEKCIRVRNATDDERITTLDGEERVLTAEDIVITDGTSGAPLGIAGIKGGMAAEVTDKTTRIIIESANFHPTYVRKTAQRLRLRTDASTRFENEPSAELTQYALSLVKGLLSESTSCTQIGYADVYPREPKHPYMTGVSLSEINNLLGTTLTEDDVAKIFERFGFSYEYTDPISRVVESAKQYEGAPYKYGASVLFDAPDEFDCSSFISFVYAHAGVGIPRVAVDQYVFGEPLSEEDLSAGDILFSVQEDESEKESFTRLEDGEKVVVDVVKQRTREFLAGTEVSGGVSHDGIYLGDGMVIHAAGMDHAGSVVVEKVSESSKFKNIVGYRRMTSKEKRFVVIVPFERMDLRRTEDLIEEVGRVYGYANIEGRTPKKSIDPTIHQEYACVDTIRAVLFREGFSEVYTHVLTETGDIPTINALASDKRYLRNNLADGMREVLTRNMRNKDLLGLSDIRLFEIGRVFTQDGECLHLSIGLGFDGKDVNTEQQEVLDGLEKKLSEVFEEKAFVFSPVEDGVMEMGLSQHCNSFSGTDYQERKTVSGDTQYKQFSQYPFATRDIAVWVPKETKSAELVSLVEEHGGELLVSVRLFDEFQKEGKVSYAYRLVFQSDERTLSDTEINEPMRVIEKAITERGWEVR